jgi:hypothetical protein
VSSREIIYLEGLTTISSYALAARLSSDERGNNLILDRVTSISNDAAEALAKHEGGLSLNGLTTLSDEAAKALAKHQGLLDLNGLTTISDEAAAALRTNPEVKLPEKFQR